MNHWPQAGSTLADGSILKGLLAQQKTLQIWSTQEQRKVLFAAQSLVEGWEEQGLTEPGLFFPFLGTCMYCEAPGYELISTAADGPYPQTSSQAMDIAQALYYTRQRFGSYLDLENALFLPQLPTLLPIPAQHGTVRKESCPGKTEEDMDAWLLGHWLSGGMDFPVTDVRRMQDFVPFLSEEAVRKILDLFGWEVTEPRRLRLQEQEEELLPVAAEPRRERQKGEFRLPGRRMLEQFFREQILDVIDREEEYRRMGISFPGPVLLEGPPGCGKTFAVDRLVEFLGWPSFEITSGTVGSMYIHETSRKIASVFSQAIENAPSVILMDEIEAFLSDRNAHHAAGSAHMEEVAEFLRLIPTLPEKKVLLFGMTNIPDIIDPAIVRKGRFDHVLKLSLPDEEELCELLDALLKNIPTEEGLTYRKILPLLSGRPVSDTAFVVREAGRLAVVNRKGRIDEELLLAACNSLKSQEQEKHIRKIGF